MNVSSATIDPVDSLQVLHLEDSALDAELVGDVLIQLGMQLEVERVWTQQDFSHALTSKHYDVILADHSLPAFDGERALIIAQQIAPDIPFIFVSGTLGEEVAVEAMKHGATDYVLKSSLHRLPASVRRAVHDAGRRQQLHQTQEALALSESRYRQIVDSARDFAIVTLDERGCITSWNSGAASILGYSTNEMLGAPQSVFFTAADQIAGVPQRELAIAREHGRTEDERWYVKAGGARLWGAGVVTRMGGDGGFLKIIRDQTRERHALDALAKSETQLRLMSDAMPALISYVDQDYRYRFHNAAYREWFGLRNEEVLGRTMSDVIGTAAFTLLRPYADRALQGERLSLEISVPYRLGGARDVLINYVPDTNTDGQVLGFYALIHNISELKAVENQLRESEQRFRSMADHAPVMVWVAGIDGGCTYLSRSWYEFTGQSEDAGLGFGWMDCVHPDDIDQIRLRDDQAIEERSAFRMEYRLRRHDGKYRWAIDAAVPRLGEDGEFLGFVGSVIDITERRRQEEELQDRVNEALASKKLFVDLVEGTESHVHVTDTQLRWRAFNRAGLQHFKRVFGAEPVVGNSLIEMAASDAAKQKDLQRLWTRALQEESFTEMVEWQEAEGRSRCYEMKFSQLRDAEGSVVGAYQFVYDVTDRQRDQERLNQAEEALRQSQKMETLGQLTGGVAHDFNNLLHPILSTLDMLNKRPQLEERTQRMLRMALESAKRARALVGRLLTFSRRYELSPSAMDMATLLDGMQDLIVHTIGQEIEVRLKFAKHLPSAMLDANQFELAILNLAINARDAMPNGGLLTIEADVESIGSAHRAVVCPGDYIRVCIVDTGEGMAPATLKRAMEPFFTTKGLGVGTGLGLSMVHSLITQLNGGMHIDSELGSGTRISLWLPVATDQEAGGDSAFSESTQHTEQTVIVIDDEEMVRVTTSDMLQDAGYKVIECSTAAEALKLASNGTQFDLVLTDHLMPGMKGSELIIALRSSHPKLAALLMTGYADVVPTELQRISKPFTKAELLVHIQNALAATKSI